jgi:anti-sigma-K factor RskA
MTTETDLKAAEYVLGTLAADERAAFARLVADDGEARRAVAEWHNRLAPLSLISDEVMPPPALWEKIESAVHGAPQASPIATQPEIKTTETKTPELKTPETRPTEVVDLTLEARRLKRARNGWRATAYLSGALAAGLALFVSTHEAVRRAEPSASYVAVVNRGGALPALIVRVDLASQNISVRPVATEVPPGKSLELWYIDEGKAPRSMGLVDKASREAPLPRGAAIEKANFAVTVEPQGGSTTGGPTGPIVYSGQLIKE